MRSSVKSLLIHNALSLPILLGFLILTMEFRPTRGILVHLYKLAQKTMSGTN